MDARTLRRLKRWFRRHRTGAVLSAVGVVAAVVAGWIVVDAATTPVVGQDIVAARTTAPAGPEPADGGEKTTSTCTPRVLTLSYSSDATVTGAVYDTQEQTGIELPVAAEAQVDVEICGFGTAVVFAAQSGYGGTTVTCTVAEGQKVLATETADGAWGVAICTA